MRKAPDYIQFYPTLQCNRACGFCFNKNMPAMPDMPLEQFRTMLDRLKDRGVSTIDIIGGEPTLHPDIVQFVREAQTRGFRVNLSSNGTNTSLLEGIQRTGKKVTVGVSINDRETLDQVREFIKKNRIIVKTVFSADIDSTLIGEILALKPKKFYLIYRDALDAAGLNSTLPFYEFVARAEKKYGVLPADLVYCSGFIPDTKRYAELASVRCPAGTTKLGVMPDGSVYPCNLFFWQESFRLGNILSDPFDRIWNHPALSFFRTFTGNVCPRRSCELHSQCHGGCPAHSALHFGELSAPDPRCIRR